VAIESAFILGGEMRVGDLNFRPFAWRPILNGDFVSGDSRIGELRRPSTNLSITTMPDGLILQRHIMRIESVNM